MQIWWLKLAIKTVSHCGCLRLLREQQRTYSADSSNFFGALKKDTFSKDTFKEVKVKKEHRHKKKVTSSPTFFLYFYSACIPTIRRYKCKCNVYCECSLYRKDAKKIQYSSDCFSIEIGRAFLLLIHHYRTIEYQLWILHIFETWWPNKPFWDGAKESAGIGNWYIHHYGAVETHGYWSANLTLIN